MLLAHKVFAKVYFKLMKGSDFAIFSHNFNSITKVRWIKG